MQNLCIRQSEKGNKRDTKDHFISTPI